MKRSEPKPKASGMKKKKFTETEDNMIIFMVKHLGLQWKQIAIHLRTRTPRQCRERWNHYLVKQNPKKEWTEEEDSFLMKLYQQYGPKWTKIAESMDERTSVSVKNRYALLNRHLKKAEALKMQKSIESFDGNEIFDANDDNKFDIDYEMIFNCEY